MTEEQIIELFIQAAEVDRKLPDRARPAKMKAMNVGYVHTFADMNGWDEAEKHAANWAWLDPKSLRTTTNDVGVWEAAMEVMKLVPSPEKRRALWAWAKSEAGGQAFAKWCKATGISRQLGDWRKNSAIECIVRTFRCKILQHNDNGPEPSFTNEGEIGDKKPMIEAWHADDAKPLHFDEGIRDFSWADAQNAKRRERDAKRRQQQAA